ncbi:hypothetical protein PCH_Pc12g15690 [Penicillium rubens Wisconsin 54-1255]|uniref:Uncharacterized protein n=1 Tax=Penicillium rubens (strain ATCC 28089 / DSM 1075 / NRRL 1951 / Wisconsin 54-1255) TaxID=500485 RepID=B6GY37_PENRW|nr:hypothetical protein PCH_Pc12g15690 [Penicillium rubens Wisconsin 54-1255]
MGDRPLEVTNTQHPDTQVPGTSNQPRPKPRCRLAYLTSDKETSRYPGTINLTPADRSDRSTSASTLYKYLRAVDVPGESDDSHKDAEGNRCMSVAEEGGWGPN